MPDARRHRGRAAADGGHPGGRRAGAAGARSHPAAARPRRCGRRSARGLRAAALTNNWVGEAPHGVTDGPRRGAHALRDHFDVVVESAVVGLRKPDPRIYALVCEKLALAPARVAFLDDIGRNLKPARELGMATIKVDDPDAALAELGTLLGFDLIG